MHSFVNLSMPGAWLLPAMVMTVAGWTAPSFAQSPAATVYKCIDAQGSIVYQQERCSPNSTAGRMPSELSVPPLSQVRPSDRSIDQCVRLHDYTRSANDFQLRSAAFVPVGDGSYQLALTGVVPAGPGAPAGRATLRCPVTGDGSVNLDLWRAQKGLANVQKPGSALTGTPAVSGAGGEAQPGANSARGNGSADFAASAISATSNRSPISAAERAGERRFIEATIAGTPLRQSEIRERLGDPDNQGSAPGECVMGTTIGAVGTPCQLPTWIYEPTALDPQTRTTIQFSQAGEAIRVTRELVR